MIIKSTKNWKFLCTSLFMISVFVLNGFCGSEDDLKKKILLNADLNGESEAELMQSDEEENKSFLSRILPQKKEPVSGEREVPFTQELYDFIWNHFDHHILTAETREYYYNRAVKSALAETDPYAQEVLLSRADYFCGMNIMESFDLTNLENMDLTDTETSDELYAEAGKLFDSGIEHAKKALSIKPNGTDAAAVYAHCISANCTAKTVSYVLKNGLKVRKYAKISIKSDPSNGTGHFLVYAQDVYAPAPFNKLRKGRRLMTGFLNDESIRLEDFDKMNIMSAIGYTYYKKKNWNGALEWYNKALKIYPNNYPLHQMIKKINKLKEKK